MAPPILRMKSIECFKGQKQPFELSLLLLMLRASNTEHTSNVQTVQAEYYTAYHSSVVRTKSIFPHNSSE